MERVPRAMSPKYTRRESSRLMSGRLPLILIIMILVCLVMVAAWYTYGFRTKPEDRGRPGLGGFPQSDLIRNSRLGLERSGHSQLLVMQRLDTQKYRW